MFELNQQPNSLDPKDSWIAELVSPKTWTPKFILLIVGIVLIGAAITAGLVLQITSQIPTVEPVPVHKDATANWKTYTNTQYGFGLSIPNSDIVESYKTGDDRIQNFTSSDNREGITTDQYFIDIFLRESDIDYSSHIENITSTKVGNYSMYMGDRTDADISPFDGYDAFIPEGKNMLVLGSSTGGDEAKKEVQQILSTFKFTNNQPINVQGNGTLKGQVTIGPFCPVERVGVPCPPPPGTFDNIKILVYAVNSTTVFKTVNLDSSGNYSTNLSAGKYTVDYQRQGNFYQHSPQPVTITASQISTLDFNIDTGIR